MKVDLSNEVLNIDFDQGAARISQVKVGGRKKNLLVQHGQVRQCRIKPSQHFYTSNFDLLTKVLFSNIGNNYCFLLKKPISCRKVALIYSKSANRLQPKQRPQFKICYSFHMRYYVNLNPTWHKNSESSKLKHSNLLNDKGVFKFDLS